MIDVRGLDAGWSADHRSLLWVSEQSSITGLQARTLYPGRLEGVGLGPEELADEVLAHVVEYWDAGVYVVSVNNAEIIKETNPYGFIPYIIFPNRVVPRSTWGEGDLEDVMTLASELNIRTSILSQLLQVSGSPPLILENVEDATGLRVGPGAVWALPEGSKAYLLEMLTSGGVELHAKFIELLYKMLHDISEMPSHGFGRDQAVGASSGVAIELMLHPVVQKVNRKRRIWDEVLDRRNRMILALAGLPVHRSRIQWPDILPKDRAAITTQEVALVAASIHSLETARRNLGDEQPAKENQLILEERQTLGMSDQGGKLRSIAGSNQPPVKLSGALVEGLSNSAG